MANSENQVELKLGLDISGVQQALYDMIGDFTGTGKEFDKITKKIEESFKNLEAVIKRFGVDSKEAAAAAATYQKSLTALVVNGINPASNSFQRLEGAVAGAGNALDKSGSNLRKNNMMWTNLALVVQDLPFGFRGIQNNLPALMSGFAGLTGPLYLAGSALIALFTIWDNNTSKTIDGINKLTEAQKRQTDIITKSAEAESEALVELSKMQGIFDGVKTGSINAEEALKKYNETYGDTWGIAKNVNEAESIFIKKSGAYVKAMAIRAMANEKYAQAQEEFKKGRLASGKDNTTFLEKFASAMDALDKVGIMGFDPAALFSYVNKLTKNFVEINTQATQEVINSAASSFDLLMAEGAALDKEANAILAKAGIKPVTVKKDKETKDKIKKEKIQYFDLTKAVDQYYNSKLDFATKDDEAQKKILQSQQATYDDLLLNNLISTVEWYDKTADIYKKIYDLNEKITNKQISDNEELNQSTKQKYNDQLSDIDQYYNNLLDFAENDKNAQKEILLQKNADLTEGLMIGAITYDDYVKRIADNSKKLSDITKAIADEAYKSLLQVGNGLMNALGPSFDMLIDKGMSLGEVLTNAFQSVLKQLAKVVATALAAVILMSILFPGKLAAAGGFNKVLGGLIGQGMGLGGLIGGGANAAGAVDASTGTNAINNIQSSLPSNDSGSFVLRGNDLVLALNRSENSLNLRRGV